MRRERLVAVTFARNGDDLEVGVIRPVEDPPDGDLSRVEAAWRAEVADLGEL